MKWATAGQAYVMGALHALGLTGRPDFDSGHLLDHVEANLGDDDGMSEAHAIVRSLETCLGFDERGLQPEEYTDEPIDWAKLPGEVLTLRQQVTGAAKKGVN